MYDVVIVHGSFGSPYENWFPWLYKELQKKGKKVLVPHFPTPEEQTLENWSSVLDAYDKYIDKNTTFIAHSIAPAFVVDYLVKKEKKVNGIIAVVPFYGLINIKEFDKINSSFFINDFKLEDIVNFTNYIHCLYSDNDPYVPIDLIQNFIKQTSSKYTLIKNGGHLNAEKGYTSFEKLIEIMEDNNQ